MSSDLLPLLQSIANRLGAIEEKIGISSGEDAGDAEELPRSIKAYDAYFNESVQPFVDACNKLGGDAVKIGNAVKEAFSEKRNFLEMAAKCKEPAQAALAPLIASVQTKMKAVGALVERNEWEKHAKTAAEGIQALNWLVVKPAPRDFIDSYIGGSDYWANNIRKEFRNINADQIAFCDTFKGILTGMMAYVKEFHTTGVAWNPKGIDTKDYEKGASPAPAAAKPPAPPAEAAKVDAPAATGAKPAVNLLAALQEKGNVTAGLKAVSKEQQTWRAEYKGDKSEPAKPKAPVAKRPVEQVKGTPKIEFVGPQNKWYVQYQSGPEEVVVTIKDKKESVYILGCLNASIRVVGKCNGIIVDSCKKCNVVFDTTMASFELVNCQRMHATCMEKVSSFAIDKTDGCIVTLPKSSLDSEIFASKSSEMNVQWYDENDDLVEKPIPEQYVHRIVDGVITANVSDLYS